MIKLTLKCDPERWEEACRVGKSFHKDHPDRSFGVNNGVGYLIDGVAYYAYRTPAGIVVTA